MPLPESQATPTSVPQTASGAQPSSPGKTEVTEFQQHLKAATPRTWVMPLLLGLNLVAYVVVALDSQSLFRPTGAVMVSWGANFGPLTTIAHQWWRAVVCCFLHFGVLHLLCNMYALFLAGLLAERLFGNWFFLLVYLTCGLAGSLASLWWHPLSVGAGASGAVFGVYGALLGYLTRQTTELPRSVLASLAKGALVFIAWNVLNGLQSSLSHNLDETMNALRDAANNGGQSAHASGPVIDQAAHLAGLLAGLLLGFVTARPLDLPRRQAMAGRQGALFGLCASSLVGLLLVPVFQANRPNAATLKLLGAMYYRGEGVARSPETAVKWLKQAADLGDAEAQSFFEGSSQVSQLKQISEDISNVVREGRSQAATNPEAFFEKISDVERAWKDVAKSATGQQKLALEALAAFMKRTGSMSQKLGQAGEKLQQSLNFTTVATVEDLTANEKLLEQSSTDLREAREFFGDYTASYRQELSRHQLEPNMQENLVANARQANVSYQRLINLERRSQRAAKPWTRQLKRYAQEPVPAPNMSRLLVLNGHGEHE